MGLKLLRILLVVLHLLHDLIIGNISGLRRVSVFLQQLGDIGIKLILNILTIRPVCVFGFIADKLLNLFSQENVGFFRELLFESILFDHSNKDVIEGFFLKGNAEILKRLFFLVVPAGLEPATQGSSGLCSTN